MKSIDLPGGRELLREKLAAATEAAGKKGASRRELARELGGEAGELGLEDAMAELVRQGRAIEKDGRWVALRWSGLVPGVVQGTKRGDAVIRSGRSGEVGYHVSRPRLHGARDGDRVLVQRISGGRRRRGARLPDAKVVSVLYPGRRTMVGFLRRSGDRWLLVPFDTKVSLEVEVGGDRLGAGEGEYVVVRIDPRATGPVGRMRGVVAERLGDVEQPGVDVLVILRHFGIEDRFPEMVIAESEERPEEPEAGDWRKREDLRSEVVVTIDGASARDFDDAISVARIAQGGYRLGVHIADVSHYVREGEALDLEAYRRGTSVYFPERAVPMLPERLSNGLCSLRPSVPRLTLSVFLDIDREGEVVRSRFSPSVISSVRRLTYEEVRRLLEERAAGDASEYGEVLDLLERAKSLMEILNGKRRRRGSIDFDLPEGDVILDTDGVTVGVRAEERNVAHRIIEEFMIAANEAVARKLDGSQIPAMYRVHEAPDRLDLEELRGALRPFGLELSGSLDNLQPAALQAILERVEGRPEAPLVSSLVLAAMRRAQYSDQCLGHYALAAPFYTHFTSPIRRYPDLIVHRCLKILLSRSEEKAEESDLRERMPLMAEHSSERERLAERAERELLQWKKVRFLADRVGEVFGGRITGVQSFGLFIRLDDYFVDGFVPIRALTDDYYYFEPDRFRLVGRRHGQTFRLADAVEVKLEGIDMVHRSLDLAVIGLEDRD